MGKDRERAENSLMLQEGETILEEMENNCNYNISQLKYIGKQAHLNSEQRERIRELLSELQTSFNNVVPQLKDIIRKVHLQRKAEDLH